MVYEFIISPEKCIEDDLHFKLHLEYGDKLYSLESKGRIGYVVEKLNGNKFYYDLDFKLHNDHGPAVQKGDHLVWYRHGLKHNENGPAEILESGARYFYINGKLHNENGPSVIRTDGTKEFHLNNERFEIIRTNKFGIKYSFKPVVGIKNKAKPIKMSKSKGNIVMIDEVVYGVSEVKSGYELRDRFNFAINLSKVDAYRNPKDGFFYTTISHGHQPLWLCLKNVPVPPLFTFDITQHPFEMRYWAEVEICYSTREEAELQPWLEPDWPYPLDYYHMHTYYLALRQRKRYTGKGIAMSEKDIVAEMKEFIGKT